MVDLSEKRKAEIKESILAAVGLEPRPVPEPADLEKLLQERLGL